MFYQRNAGIAYVESNVAQASSLWQQHLNQIIGLLQKNLKLATSKQVKINRFRGPGGWLLGLTIVVAMLFWNWKLLLATGAGVLVMLLVYLMHEWDWQVFLSDIRRFLSSSNRQLTLAVGSGGISAVSTYMAASIWVDSDSPWIATGAIIQGFGTLVTIILLVWQIISRQASRDETKLNGILTDLTDTDPLKRLIALRQLTHQVKHTHLERDKRRQLSEYLSLMLSREQENVVRDAVLEGLQALDNTQVLHKVEPFKTPIVLKRTAVKIRHLK